MSNKECADSTLTLIKAIYNKVFEDKEQNEQWFLNWLDDLNKISISW